jgi:predicted NUDIX family NTP pyrophosphohydrolase
MYRRTHAGAIEILLVHPGGPLFAKKDSGVWSIPKGEPNPGEDLLSAAQREFQEETGWVPTPPFLPLKNVRLKSGKIIHAWAFEGDCEPETLASNSFAMEWPPRSGQRQSFPEVDAAAFFALEDVRQKAHEGQVPLFDELLEKLGVR